MFQYNSGILRHQRTKDNLLKRNKIDTKRVSNEKDLTFTFKYHKDGTSEIKEKVIEGDAWNAQLIYLEKCKTQDIK